ncbi:hypothetical protein PoB_007550300 [Plakobranchus ocellatus]|uniref:Uncharacterized protein n=1 Tax=Plakobranchus ocellatus TaxID=259542 RepID=A0AAV4DY31_9GAST|nr:hypothetical protein PoB_007550300 [Plakobranchus ocellatus]
MSPPACRTSSDPLSFNCNHHTHCYRYHCYNSNSKNSTRGLHHDHISPSTNGWDHYFLSNNLFSSSSLAQQLSLATFSLLWPCRGCRAAGHISPWCCPDFSSPLCSSPPLTLPSMHVEYNVCMRSRLFYPDAASQKFQNHLKLLPQQGPKFEEPAANTESHIRSKWLHSFHQNSGVRGWIVNAEGKHLERKPYTINQQHCTELLPSDEPQLVLSESLNHTPDLCIFKESDSTNQPITQKTPQDNGSAHLGSQTPDSRFSPHGPCCSAPKNTTPRYLPKCKVSRFTSAAAFAVPGHVARLDAFAVRMRTSIRFLPVWESRR